MAFGVSITVQSIFPMIDAQGIFFPQIAYVVLGFLAAAVSIRWLVSSAEVLDGADELRVEYSEQKQGVNEEGLAGLIITMMAYYRENKSTIKTMVLISRIAGGCFLVSGTFSLATALASIMAGAPPMDRNNSGSRNRARLRDGSYMLCHSSFFWEIFQDLGLST